MRIPKEQDKITFFQSLYDDAVARTSIIGDKLERHLKQYKGDAEIDGSRESASTVRNITYELIESQINTSVPLTNVFPQTPSDRATLCAKSVETFLRNKRQELPFKSLNDIDERMTTIYGGSIWLVEWDDSVRTKKTVGGVKISCVAPTKFVGQPFVYDINDMEYCFIAFENACKHGYSLFGEYIGKG